MLRNNCEVPLAPPGLSGATFGKAVRLLVLANSTVWAGAEVFIWRLCRELCGLGIPVVVVYPPEGPLAERFKQLPLSGVYCQQLGVHSARIRGTVGSLALLDPLARRRYSRLLDRMRRDGGCDTVLCQYPREQALVTGIAKSMGYRVVWIIHSKQHYLANRIMVNPMLRRAMLSAEPAFVISEATKGSLARDGFPERMMKALRVGVDVPAGDASEQADRPPTVGVVCRLVRLKGVQDILSAAPAIVRQLPNVEFVIAGGGRYRVALEEKAQELGISKSVRFVGFVENTQEIYKRLDVLAHTTFDPGDSMPTSILEAAAAGVPAVATRWAGIPDIVRDGETGILVPPHDVNSIRDSLLRILTDRVFAARLGENARAFVSSYFSMAAVARDFLRALDGCSAARVSPPDSPDRHD